MTDALTDVQAELSAAMMPWPDDVLEDLTPQAAIFYLRQCCMATAKIVLGAAISLGGDGDEEAGALDEVNNGLAMAVVGVTHACVALEILPKEAEEALTQ